MPLTTTFVGVDADAIGNGDPDETQVIDTWLQRRIQYNNEALLAPKHGVCFTPIIGANGGTFTSLGGNRPICSFEWATRWKGPLLVYADQTYVDVTFAYQADTPGSASQAGTVEVRVSCINDGSKVIETLASTYDSGTKTGHQTVRLTFNGRVNQPQLYEFELAFRSNSTSYIVTTIGDSSDGTTSSLYHQFPFRFLDGDTTAPKFFTPNSSGTPPDGDSLEAMWILMGSHTDWEVAPGGRYDLLWTDDTTSSGSQAGTLQKVLPPSAAATATSGTAFMHVCLMLRAVFIEPGFDSVPPRAWQPPQKFAPNQEFGSAEAMFQASEVARAYRQPSVALIGPRGRMPDTGWDETDLDSFAANGYPVFWPSVLGDYDGLASGQNLDLINEGFFLRTENPRLELVCRWLCVHHGAAFNVNQLDTGNKTKGRIQKSIVSVTSGPGSSRWDVTASVHQLADASSGTGDWATDITEYGAFAEGVTVPVYGASVTDGSDEQPPVLRGVDSIVNTGKSGVTYPGFWFKEGLLFGDHGDFEVLHETRHDITLSDLTQTEVLRPFRLKLDAILDDYSDPVNVGAADGDLRLILTSFTLIEHPQ